MDPSTRAVMAGWALLKLQPDSGLVSAKTYGGNNYQLEIIQKMFSMVRGPEHVMWRTTDPRQHFTWRRAGLIGKQLFLNIWRYSWYSFPAIYVDNYWCVCLVISEDVGRVVEKQTKTYWVYCQGVRHFYTSNLIHIIATLAIFYREGRAWEICLRHLW